MTGVVKRVGLEALGWLLLVGGIAALVLPGPGLVMVFAGLAVLSQRYEWAERRLAPVKYRALRSSADSVATLPRIAVSTLGVLFLLAVGALWTIQPAAPGWWPLDEKYWLLGGTGTGLTLIFSGLLAAGILIYSYRRFHGHPEEIEALEAETRQADEQASSS